MDVRLHSLFARASSLLKPAIAVGLVILTALLAITAFAESWEKKDWTQWSSQDCYHILSASPWAVVGPILTDYYTKSPGQIGETTYTPTAQMATSLVIREGLVRQAQLLQHYHKMTAQQRQAFDAKANTCLSKTYDDRFVVHIIGAAIPGPFRLFVDGRQVPAVTLLPASISPCISRFSTTVAFKRVVDGKPVIQDGAKKIQMMNPSDYTFTFNAEKMIYKGKLDY